MTHRYVLHSCSAENRESHQKSVVKKKQQWTNILISVRGLQCFDIQFENKSENNI